MTANPTLLQMKYARIVSLFSKESGMSLDDALAFFYGSELYQLVKRGVSDLHCMSDAYLVEDLLEEYKNSGIPLEKVMEKHGITQEEIDAMEDVDIE